MEGVCCGVFSLKFMCYVLWLVEYFFYWVWVFVCVLLGLGVWFLLNIVLVYIWWLVLCLVIGCFVFWGFFWLFVLCVGMYLRFLFGLFCKDWFFFECLMLYMICVMMFFVIVFVSCFLVFLFCSGGLGGGWVIGCLICFVFSWGEVLFLGFFCDCVWFVMGVGMVWSWLVRILGRNLGWRISFYLGGGVLFCRRCFFVFILLWIWILFCYGIWVSGSIWIFVVLFMFLWLFRL